ncbi:MAG: aminoacyl-histidine dipeptidase [Bacteroidales bacterium]|nr:aminoacyl-histidine dipeptidase [Bacteroidales bacterium]
MNEALLDLEPKRIWYYFKEILDIPRPSKKEEKIAAYLMDFAKKHNLEVKKDKVGNILISKPGTSGKETAKTVILQSHIDMVGEKNSDVNHNFEKDAIEAYIDDKGWVRAKGTTLGADDGIGIAAQLAILEADNIEHPPIECLFTVDEETGMTGAFGLDENFLTGKILLNLDSEDDGELFIGCAGGKDTVGKLIFERETTPANHLGYVIKISGLKGGHSGDDIHKGRGNANKILNRLIWNLTEEFDARLNSFDAGNLRNAIAREGKAIIALPKGNEAGLEAFVQQFEKDVKDELHVTEPNVKIEAGIEECPDEVLKSEYQSAFLNMLYAMPHGVIAWSQDIENFVETSTNLAAVKTKEDHFHVTTSQRSSVESAKKDIGDRVASVFRLAGAAVEQGEGYPGWTPNPDSEIKEITADSYEMLFNEKPKVLAIHAGLECGLIGTKYPELDMISYGPTIKGAHSPDEGVEIKTVEKFWDLTLDVLKKID